MYNQNPHKKFKHSFCVRTARSTFSSFDSTPTTTTTTSDTPRRGAFSAFDSFDFPDFDFFDLIDEIEFGNFQKSQKENACRDRNLDDNCSFLDDLLDSYDNFSCCDNDPNYNCNHATANAVANGSADGNCRNTVVTVKVPRLVHTGIPPPVSALSPSSVLSKSTLFNLDSGSEKFENEFAVEKESVVLLKQEEKEGKVELKKKLTRKRRKNQWTNEEVALLLLCTKMMIDYELKSVAQIVFELVERDPGKCWGRAAEKKLKRMKIFTSWKGCNKEEVLRKIDVELNKLDPSPIRADLYERLLNSIAGIQGEVTNS